MAKDLAFSKDRYHVQTDEVSRAEYSPWGRIFMRLEMIVDRVTEFSMEARLKNLVMIEPFFNSLQELYDAMTPLLIDGVIAIFDPRFENLTLRVKTWNRQMNVIHRTLFPDAIVRDLETMKRDLFELKQQIGLGVPVEKVASTKKKLERALGTAGANK